MLSQEQTSNCCQEWRMLHLHLAILSPNLACSTGRRGTQTSRSTWATRAKNGTKNRETRT